MKNNLILALALLLHPYYAFGALVTPPNYHVQKSLTRDIKKLDNLAPEDVYAIRMTFDLKRRADFNEQEWSALLQTATDCLKSLEDKDVSIKCGLETTKKLHELAKSTDWVDGSITLSFAQQEDMQPTKDEVVEQDEINAQTVNNLQVMFEVERDNNDYDTAAWKEIVALSIACAQRFADDANNTFDDTYNTMNTIFERAQGSQWASAAVHITMTTDK